MLFFSVAHSPKSISWQRSLQNGRKLFASLQTTVLLQVGQLTVRACWSLMATGNSQIVIVQSRHLGRELLNIAVIIQNIVGPGQP